MRRFSTLALLATSLVPTLPAVWGAAAPPASAPSAVAKAPAVAAAPIAPVWQARLTTFDDYAYEAKVEALIANV